MPTSRRLPTPIVPDAEMAKMRRKPDPITPAKLRRAGWTRDGAQCDVWHHNINGCAWLFVNDSSGETEIMASTVMPLRTVRDFADLQRLVAAIRGDE